MDGRNTAALLYQAYLRLAEQINTATIARNPGSRPAHATVFIHMENEGIRLTRLAEKAMMTPQAMGELVDDLERLGYLRRVPDPTDRRAKLIVFTDQGRAALDSAFEVIARVERDLERLLGPRKLASLQAMLELITAS
ncbi:MAG TPA: MarR family transcriptional regulator [Amycolatopsis sp.]|nr:MarR family transcriptional regulator [Amycolatopsis sp.]